MLSYAVQNDDLDTMRACYMIEAFSGVVDLVNASSQQQELESSVADVHRQVPIIQNSGGTLSNVGYGNATRRSDIGNTGIVLKPKVFDYFGQGNSTGSFDVAAPR